WQSAAPAGAPGAVRERPCREAARRDAVGAPAVAAAVACGAGVRLRQADRRAPRAPAAPLAGLLHLGAGRLDQGPVATHAGRAGPGPPAMTPPVPRSGVRRQPTSGPIAPGTGPSIWI